VWSSMWSVARLMRWLCARYLLMTRGHVRAMRKVVLAGQRLFD
jgi:hypothetical protein